MKTRAFKFIFSILLLFNILNSKEILVEGFSSIKQTKFELRSGPSVFTEKHQNINGDLVEEWNVNGSNIDKDSYFQEMLLAEKEELEIKQKEEQRKLEEVEIKRREEAAIKERDTQKKARDLRVQALKRLIVLHADSVESSFDKLERYNLQNYYVFSADTFSTSKDLEKAKFSFLNKAKSLSIKDLNELDEAYLKKTLNKLERLPQRVELFFEQSVKFAINNSTDTRKLKELLTLI